MSIQALGKNTVIYAVGNISSRTAAFILIPIYTHALPVSDYGMLATIFVCINLMVIFTNLGMRTAFVRFVDDVNSDRTIGVLLGSTGFITLCSGMIVMGATVTFFIPFYQTVLHVDDVRTYVILACIAAFLQTLSLHLMTYYRTRNMPVKFMLIGVATAAILILSSLFFLYYLKLGIQGALYGLIATHGCIIGLLGMDIFPKTGISVTFSLLPELARFGSPIAVSEMSSVIMESAGVFFLSYYLDLKSVAIFSLGFKFANIFCIIVSLPFLLAFQPYFFQQSVRNDIQHQISRMLTYLVLATTFSVPFIILVSGILLDFSVPPSYSPAFVVVLLLIPGMVFNGAISFGDTLLSAAKKTKLLGITMFGGAIVNIICNYSLIPEIGWHGAVAAQNVSLIVTGISLVLLGSREYPFQVEWKRILVLFSLMFCTIFLYYIFRGINGIMLVLLTIAVVAGGMALLILFRFFDENEAAYFKKTALSIK